MFALVSWMSYTLKWPFCCPVGQPLLNIVTFCCKTSQRVFGLNIFISFLQLYKHINIYVNNSSNGIRTEAKKLIKFFSLKVLCCPNGQFLLLLSHKHIRSNAISFSQDS